MVIKQFEKERLSTSSENRKWKRWGPYVSDRQWGTVREDYSADGNTWEAMPHDKARSNAYRWGEDAIAGFCDHQQILCLAPVFWNGKDSILKERLFGLTNYQGNHGEDVKELYFHLDSSPTHSYCKFLYKYPKEAYPYSELIEKNQIGKYDPEFEILDSDAFKNSNYYDCLIEYAKEDPNDILMRITVTNRSKSAGTIHVLPHLWFRNYWKHNRKFTRPLMRGVDLDCVRSTSVRNGNYYFYHQEGPQLFCENETNNEAVYGGLNEMPYVKDGINNYIIHDQPTVNPKRMGTKVAIWHRAKLKPGESKTFKVRLSRLKLDKPWKDYDEVFHTRIVETNQFYDSIIPAQYDAESRKVIRQAFAGLLWTKQFYYLDVFKWLFGEPGDVPPFRMFRRNFDWQHLTNRDIISMPDKWEYPWYAAWDLAFHTISFAKIDPDFAKEQLLLVLREYYMHPNGQIPAYEWNFSDVNPPVHSYAVWEVFERDKQSTGVPDYDFLERAFQKLLLNFTWWVNQKDRNGNDLFDGGFLGLDNIGVFDRNSMPSGIKLMQQSDATSWMAMFALNMLRMSLELAHYNRAYEESAAKFFRHFLNIAWAMHHIGEKDISLWDDQDAFYYDVVQLENGENHRMKVRSLVGIIPLFAVEIIHSSVFDHLVEFKTRAATLVRTRPDLASLISRIEEKNEHGNYLFSIMRGFRLEHLLKRLLDENEFLSPYGIRSLSKYHLDNPFVFEHNGRHRIQYEAGVSTTSMFGGNSNWRGPIWFPINYMIIQSLRKYYRFYGPTYIYEFPAGSGNQMNLKQIADELTRRLLKIFERDHSGKYTYHTKHRWNPYAKNSHFKDLHLFYEFFDGDNGQGLGASHQTGWSALIANLILDLEPTPKN